MSEHSRSYNQPSDGVTTGEMARALGVSYPAVVIFLRTAGYRPIGQRLYGTRPIHVWPREAFDAYRALRAARRLGTLANAKALAPKAEAIEKLFAAMAASGGGVDR